LPTGTYSGSFNSSSDDKSMTTRLPIQPAITLITDHPRLALDQSGSGDQLGNFARDAFRTQPANGFGVSIFTHPCWPTGVASDAA